MSRFMVIGAKVKRFFWAAFLLSLPITNFRYFPGFIAGSKIQVRPLVIIPMVILLLISIPRIWNKKLPRYLLPLLVFLIFATVSNSLPFIMGVTSELSETTYAARLLRTLITLFLGLGIYLTVSITPKDEEDLRFTLKWLYAGLALAIFWGSLQMIYVLELLPNWYVIMSKIQKHITTTVGSPQRIMGLTLEPSWFADQISALWLPWVLTAAIQDRTVFSKRWKWITIERILLVWMIVVLLFTLSRAGLVVAVVVIGFGLLFIRNQNPKDDKKYGEKSWWRKVLGIFNKIPRPLLNLIGGVLLVAIISGVIYFIARDNKYINRMWLYWIKNRAYGTKSLAGFFHYIGFGPRFVYWETALRIFKEYPLFGVGLGNYTFHFKELLPSVQVGFLPEILINLVPDNIRISTPKNYFARLLAETGLFGTGAFVTFLSTLFLGGIYLWSSDNSEARFWGAGSVLALIAFLVDSFSYDSFAIPNPWVVFGLITAAATVFSTLPREKKRGTSEE